MLVLTPKVFGTPNLTFYNPTPANNSILWNVSYAEINLSITEQNLNTFKFNWNNTNYTFYDSSLVLAMNFNNNSAIGENSTTAIDISKYGNNGTLNGATWTTSGRFGGAMYFDGNDYIDCGASNSFNTSTNKITIEAWVKVNSLEAPSEHLTIVNKNTYNGYWGDSIYWFWAIPKENKIGFKIKNVYDFRPSYTWDLNWHHLVGTYDGYTMKVFADGSLVDSYSITKTMPDATLPVLIGTCSGIYFFNGSIDEVRIYNRALSADEIKMHYNSEFQKYNSTDWRFYNNITNISNGAYYYYGWADDTSGNAGISEIRFFEVGSVAPQINISYPASDNVWFDINPLNINFTITSSHLDSCWWSVNGKPNITIPNCTTGMHYSISNVTWDIGQNNLTIWANNTIGNVSSATRRFIINNPVITFIIRDDKNQSLNGIPYNFNSFTNLTNQSISLYKFNYSTGLIINITDVGSNNFLINFYNYNYTPNISDYSNETLVLNIPKTNTSIITNNNTIGTYNINYSLNISFYAGQKFNLSFSTADDSDILCVYCDALNGTLNLPNFKYNRIINFSVKNNYYDDIITRQITNYHSNNTLVFYDENAKTLLNLASSTSNYIIQTCDENTTNINITSQYQNITINCNNPTLNFYQTYGSTTYYRGLMPQSSVENPRQLNFTMINLNTTNAIILTIVFSGTLPTDIIRIYDGTTLLSEQKTDISSTISFIAIQYHSYIIHLVRNGNVRVLGNLIADYTGTKYISISPFTFGVEQQINDFIFMSSERTSTYAKITYYDILNKTNFVYCNFTDTNDNLQIESIVYYSNNITFTYNNNTNASLFGNCLINHQTFDTFQKTFLFFGNETEEYPIKLKLLWLDYGTKKYIAISIILVLVLLTAVYPTISLLILSGCLLLFNFLEWFIIPIPIMAVIIVFSIIYVLAKSRNQTI